MDPYYLPKLPAVIIEHSVYVASFEHGVFQIMYPLLHSEQLPLGLGHRFTVKRRFVDVRLNKVSKRLPHLCLECEVVQLSFFCCSKGLVKCILTHESIGISFVGVLRAA